MIHATGFVGELAMRIAAGRARGRAVAFFDSQHAVRASC